MHCVGGRYAVRGVSLAGAGGSRKAHNNMRFTFGQAICGAGPAMVWVLVTTVLLLSTQMNFDDCVGVL